MFFALIAQYLNKLIEGKVGYLSPPEPFHAIKIQGFRNNGIKTFAQVGRKFPMPVFPLVRYLPIESCEFTDSAPPVARTFDFTRKAFVEFSQLGQGLFQELRRLYFLAVAQGQKRVFHTEVRTYAFTCWLQRFGIYKICYDAKPIVAYIVSLDCQCFDFAVIRPMF